MPPGSDTVDFTNAQKWAEGLAERGRLPPQGGDPPHGGGSDELSRRVGALEADIKSLVKDSATIKERLAGIEGRLSNLPTTFQTLTWFVGISLGLVGLVFTIARTVGAH